MEKELHEEFEVGTKKWLGNFERVLDLLQSITEHSKLLDDTTELRELIDRCQRLDKESCLENKVLSELVVCDGVDGNVMELFNERLRDNDLEASNFVGYFPQKISAIKLALHPTDPNDTLVVDEIYYSRKDPVTKKNIEDPVQNTVCKHVYDRVSIDEYIKECKKRHQCCQCPVGSCPNKKKLAMSNMIPFPQFFDHVKN